MNGKTNNVMVGQSRVRKSAKDEIRLSLAMRLARWLRAEIRFIRTKSVG